MASLEFRREGLHKVHCAGRPVLRFYGSLAARTHAGAKVSAGGWPLKHRRCCSFLFFFFERGGVVARVHSIGETVLFGSSREQQVKERFFANLRALNAPS